MTRFVFRALLFSTAATVVWWATAGWTRPSTVASAKLLHSMVGYPAPYLLADLDDYHWFAPLFPPFVGLVAASYWVSTRRRIAGLAVGLITFWYLVALQIAVLYSPYLTLSAARAYFMSVQIALNSVAVPVVLWLIVVGGPPGGWEIERAHAGDDATPDALGRAGLLTLLFCAVLTLPVPAAISQTTPTLSAAREAVARAIANDNTPSAIRSIERMFTVQRENAALSYLQMELHRKLGQTAAADELMPAALTTHDRRMAYAGLRR